MTNSFHWSGREETNGFHINHSVMCLRFLVAFQRDDLFHAADEANTVLGSFVNGQFYHVLCQIKRHFKTTPRQKMNTKQTHIFFYRFCWFCIHHFAHIWSSVFDNIFFSAIKSSHYLTFIEIRSVGWFWL